MEYPGFKANARRRERVIIWEVDTKEEQTTAVACVALHIKSLARAIH